HRPLPCLPWYERGHELCMELAFCSKFGNPALTRGARNNHRGVRVNRLIVFVFCLIFAQLAGCATPESEIASAHPHSKQQIMSISSFTLTYYRRGDANALRVVS